MLIAIHDAERDHMPGKTFPNYALMKISAWHKANGDAVEWWDAFRNDEYDRVYSSKVFDFTPENPYLPQNTIKGGTGYDVKSKLPPEIDAIFPDYSIYPECDYAIGYLTRGCPNACRWCVVPEKEGKLAPSRIVEQLRRPDSNKLTMLDNNFLALPSPDLQDHLMALINSGLRVDFNQGLDARLVTRGIAYMLAQIKWQKYIRFSCDTSAQIPAIENAVKLLAANGIAKSKIFVYFLVTTDLADAKRRVDALQKLGAITVYAQAERNERLNIRPNAAQLEFAQRYVYGGSWRRETWREYCKRHNVVQKEK